MSLSIRYLTNGKKTVYQVINEGVTPVYKAYFSRIEDIPYQIRHYAPKGEATFVDEGMAYVLGAGEYFYPNFPMCGHPEYKTKRCIANDCKYAKPSYKQCPWFPGYDDGKTS